MHSNAKRGIETACRPSKISKFSKFLQPYQLAFQETCRLDLLNIALTLPVTSTASSLHFSAFSSADVDLTRYVTIGLSLVSNYFARS